MWKHILNRYEEKKKHLLLIELLELKFSNNITITFTEIKLLYFNKTLPFENKELWYGILSKKQ